MGKYTKVAQEKIEQEIHPSQDTTNRFPLDILLRSHGFAIYKREKGKQPLWECNGKIYVYEEAFSSISEEEIEIALNS